MHVHVCYSESLSDGMGLLIKRRGARATKLLHWRARFAWYKFRIVSLERLKEVVQITLLRDWLLRISNVNCQMRFFELLCIMNLTHHMKRCVQRGCKAKQSLLWRWDTFTYLANSLRFSIQSNRS